MVYMKNLEKKFVRSSTPYVKSNHVCNGDRFPSCLLYARVYSIDTQSQRCALDVAYVSVNAPEGLAFNICKQTVCNAERHTSIMYTVFFAIDICGV